MKAEDKNSDYTELVKKELKITIPRLHHLIRRVGRFTRSLCFAFFVFKARNVSLKTQIKVLVRIVVGGGVGGWSVIRQQPWRARQSVKVCMDTGTSSQVSDLLSAVFFTTFQKYSYQLFS